MTTIIIAEKPDAAQHISEALAQKNLKKKMSEQEVPWWEFERDGKKFITLAAVGHLFGLKQKKGIKQNPVFEVEWKPNYLANKKSEFSKKYFETIEKFKDDGDEFIIACDFDNEGTVIGFNILKFIFGKEDAKRMKFSTLTKPDLIKSYQEIMPHIDKENLECGYTRHVVDFYYGINVSRGLMEAIKKASPRFMILSAGRVQGPLLTLLSEREKQIKAFKPVPFWQMQAIVLLDGKEITAEHLTDKFWKKPEADSAHKNSQAKTGIVDSAEKKEHLERPPVPFNITSLQTEAYKLFGYSPQQTMQIAQSLYTAAYCLTGDSKLQLPDGSIISIKEVVERNIGSVIGIDSNLKTKEVKVTNWLKRSVDKLNQITFANGDKIKVTGDHPLLTLRNGNLIWIPAKALTEEDYVAAPDKISITRQSKGSLIFDALDFIPESSLIRIKTKREFSKIIISKLKSQNKTLKDLGYKKFTIYKYSSFSIWPYGIVRKFFNEGILSEEDLRNNIVSYYLATGTSKRSIQLPLRIDAEFLYFAGLVAADGHNDGNHILFPKIDKFGEVLADIGKYFGLPLQKSKSSYYFSSVMLSKVLSVLSSPTGNKAAIIDIPNIILTQPEESLCSFIAGFVDGDGSIKLKKTGSGKSLSVRTCITSISRTFISKLKSALLTIGVSSYIYEYPKHSTKTALDLLVYTDDFETFVEKIGRFLKIRLPDLEKALAVHTLIKPFRHSHKLVPLPKSALADCIVSNHGARIQKLKLSLIGPEKSEILNILGNSDVTWVKIKSIKDLPGEDVFDLTTDSGNFIAENIVVHNCSYPRTSSEKLPPQIGYRETLEAVGKIPKYKKLVQKLLSLPQLKPTEGKRDDPAHEAIHPTVEPPNLEKLKGPQKNIYDLIVRRFFALFGEPAVREGMKIVLNIGKEQYKVLGRRTIKPGWIEFYGPLAKFDEIVLPNLKKGDSVPVKKIEMLDKETQPPSRWSQASIIKEMEKRGLGTRATRSAILQTLYDRKYATDKSVRVTDLGMKIAETLKNFVPDFVDEKMTRELEGDMEKILTGKSSRKRIVEAAKKHVIKICDELKENENKIGKNLGTAIISTQEDANTFGNCIKCGDGKLKFLFSIFTKKHFVGCSNYSHCAVCGFTKTACKCKCPICGKEKGKCKDEWKAKEWKPKCATGYPLPHQASFQRLDRVCDKCKTPIIRVMRKGKRPFNMCLDPQCETKKDWGKPGEKKDFKKGKNIRKKK